MAPDFYFTIAETIERFRRKELSPVELVTAHLERVQSLQPRLNAFVHLDAESAIAGARQAEAAAFRGDSLLPLHGIPLTVKSCIDVAGWPCPAGSLLRKDFRPVANATLVSRLESAGAILLGNTNTSEFLMAYETDNCVTGRTSNPWNLSYSAGGSSGGEAAAIASGCSMGGVGSDGGGSIRTPAHFTGICGLKPTPGRIPATGHFPPPDGAFSWLGVVGPLARTVGDLRILLDVISGPRAGDPLSVPVPKNFNSSKDLRGLRVGVLQSDAFGSATPETLGIVNKAAGLLSAQGFHVEPFALEKLAEALDLWWYFFGSVIGHQLRQSTKDQDSLLSPMLREYLDITAAEPPGTLDNFLAACVERDALRSDLLYQMRDVPILLSPVSSTPAFRHGAGNYRSGDPYNYRDTMRYCQWLNLAGFPGVSIPLGRSPIGLPINVQLIGRPFEEGLLLNVAEALQLARGPWQAPPALE